MPKFNVTMPFVGYVTIGVEVNDKEDAISTAYDANLNMVAEDVQPKGILAVFVEEWGLVEEVTRGNVCYAPVNRATVEEIEETDE